MSVDLQYLINAVQVAIATNDANYTPTIKTTIIDVWANVCEQYDWWFMRAPAPLDIVVAANTRTVILSRETGPLLYIADPSTNLTVWDFREDIDLQSEKAYRGTVDPEGAAIEYYTLKGLIDRKKVLEVWPVSSLAVTRKVYYSEDGVEGNLQNMPSGWANVLIHGTLARIAPPKAMPQERWRAIQYEQNSMYVYWLKEMATKHRAVAVNLRPTILDSYMQEQIDEINSW